MTKTGERVSKYLTVLCIVKNTHELNFMLMKMAKTGEESVNTSHCYAWLMGTHMLNIMVIDNDRHRGKSQ